MNPGSWNRYSYAGGDPINHIDPTGTDLVYIPGWGVCDTLDPDAPCYQGNPCASYGSMISTLEDSPAAATYYAQATALGCGAPVQEVQDNQHVTTPDPTCTLQLDVRGLDALRGRDFFGIAHGYLSMTYSNLPGYTSIFEGQWQGDDLKGYAGKLGLRSYPSDNPKNDSTGETMVGPQVCAFAGVLNVDVDELNNLNIVYKKLGPNSNSFLRYMLQSLPGGVGNYFVVPFLWGFNARLPGLDPLPMPNSPRPPRAALASY